MTGVPLRWTPSGDIKGSAVNGDYMRKDLWTRDTAEAGRGAVVIEATISMTAFMFAILIILSIADIAYVQSKMAVALNSAAGEISQYCYLYYKFQLDKANAKASEGTEDAEKTVNETVKGMGQMMDSFGQAGSDFGEGDFISAIESIEDTATTANETVSNLVNNIAENPKGFLVGMGKLAGREMIEDAKVYLGQFMAKAFMAKNLKAYTDDDPDAFLRRLHVVDGMDGLDFQYTSLMAYGSSNEINLVCTYQVRVVRLLNIDYKFTFRQCAKTLAWGDGVSLVTPRSIWTSMDPMYRGKYIVGEEKKGYSYTSSGQGFDAFVNSGGRNEFVTITSIDSSSKSYETADGLARRLDQDLRKMCDSVPKLGDTITVQHNGSETTVNSDPSSRTYKLVVVFPEGTSKDYKEKITKDAIAKLKEKHPDITLQVDVKEGYGSLPEKKSGTDASEDGGAEGN